MKILRKASRLLTVLVAIGITLTACVPGAFPWGGEPRRVMHSREQATADLLAVPGVINGSVETTTAGLQQEHQVRLKLADDFDPSKVATLIDYALAQAWAADERKPDSATTLMVTQEGDNLPLVPAADELGFPGQAEPQLRIGNGQMAKRYGNWPGRVPALPAELAGREVRLPQTSAPSRWLMTVETPSPRIVTP